MLCKSKWMILKSGSHYIGEEKENEKKKDTRVAQLRKNEQWRNSTESEDMHSF